MTVIARQVAVTHRKPRRIQRQRSKGWRKPVTAVDVTRRPEGMPPNRYANPYRIGDPHPDTGQRMTRDDVYDLYAAALATLGRDGRVRIQRDLAGRDLMCWCAPTKKCHADLLLVAANDPEWVDLAPEIVAGDTVEGAEG